MPSAKPESTENQFIADIREMAILLGWHPDLIYHTHDSRLSDAGFPDLAMIDGDFMLCLETKVKNRIVTPHQEAWLTALNGVTRVRALPVWPKDWAEITALLRRRA